MVRYAEKPLPSPGASQSTSVRGKMLEMAALFVNVASHIAGVRRVALIGSITDEKPEPKDLDLLVTVENDLDLTVLARLGRQVRGRLQSTNRGCDVFLADADNNYIGRLCIWRQCGPGIRATCDARHCGRREFLHDDLDDISLGADLIREPPVELWPTRIKHRPIPADLAAIIDTPDCTIG